MDKMIKKKGEIATSTIVTIILLIIGAVIIMFLFRQISWTGVIDREVCHQSIIYRATLPGFAGIRDYVPIKCKTEKICVTAGMIGGKCDEFKDEKGIVTAKVRDKDEVEQIIARDVLECWKTMGEGKISVFSPWLAQTYGIGTVYPSCVICSRIAFDSETLEKKGINLSEIDILRYMQTHTVPTEAGVSYYEYFTREGGKYQVEKELQIIDIEEQDNELFVSGDKINVEVEELARTDPEDKELAVLFMQISAPKHTEVFKNTLITLGIGMGTTFLMSPRAAKGTLGLAKNPYAIAVLVIAGLYQHGSVVYNKAITLGYCGDVSVGDEAREGCSVVRTVNYDATAISQYCTKIESIP